MLPEHEQLLSSFGFPRRPHAHSPTAKIFTMCELTLIQLASYAHFLLSPVYVFYCIFHLWVNILMHLLCVCWGVLCDGVICYSSFELESAHLHRWFSIIFMAYVVVVFLLLLLLDFFICLLQLLFIIMSTDDASSIRFFLFCMFYFCFGYWYCFCGCLQRILNIFFPYWNATTFFVFCFYRAFVIILCPYNFSFVLV